MEREGKNSHAGDDRRAAQERNRQRAALAAALASAAAELGERPAGVSGERDMIGQMAAGSAGEAQALQDDLRRRQQAREAEERRVEQQAKGQAEHQVRQAEEMQRQQDRLDAFRAEQQLQAEEARDGGR